MHCVSKCHGLLYCSILIEYAVAGPKRPIPKEATTSSVVNGQWQSQLQTRAQALASQASKTGSDLYNNLASAMSERGYVIFKPYLIKCHIDGEAGKCYRAWRSVSVPSEMEERK